MRCFSRQWRLGDLVPELHAYSNNQIVQENGVCFELGRRYWQCNAKFLLELCILRLGGTTGVHGAEEFYRRVSICYKLGTMYIALKKYTFLATFHVVRHCTSARNVLHCFKLGSSFREIQFISAKSIQ